MLVLGEAGQATPSETGATRQGEAGQPLPKGRTPYLTRWRWLPTGTGMASVEAQEP